MLVQTEHHAQHWDLKRAFTLIEAITVLMIASLIAVAVVEVYARVRRSAESVNRKLDENILEREVLQRIAEDLDRMAAPGFDAVVTVRNKLSNGYNISQLVIETSYLGSGADAKPQTYERVIWQTAYDPYTDSLIVYRAHQGLRLEDAMVELDLAGNIRPDARWFVPLCDGITYFEVQVPAGENFVNQWTQTALPKAVTISISTSTPVQDEQGQLVIPERGVFTRTIAIDRTRKIRYRFVAREFDMSDFRSNEPNDIAGSSAEGDTEGGETAAGDEARDKPNVGPEDKPGDRGDGRGSRGQRR